MALTGNKAQGSTLTFASTEYDLLDMTYSESATAIDITHMTDGVKTVEQGPDDIEITCTLNGATGVVAGATGALTVNWQGAEVSQDTVSSALCVSQETNGSYDDKVTSSLTFKPGI